MSRKRRLKNARPRPAQPVPAEQTRPSPARALPPVVWEANIYGQGGYESAARFLLNGLIETGVDVEIWPMWANVTLRELQS